MSTRVEVLNEVTTVNRSPRGTWKLALQWCPYVNDEAASTCYGFRFIWQDQEGNLRSAAGKARLHSINPVRDVLRKAEAAGWGGHDATAASDGRQRAADASGTLMGEVPPQGALALAGAWGEFDDQEISEVAHPDSRVEYGEPAYPAVRLRGSQTDLVSCIRPALFLQ